MGESWIWVKILSVRSYQGVVSAHMPLTLVPRTWLSFLEGKYSLRRVRLLGQRSEQYQGQTRKKKRFSKGDQKVWLIL